MRLLVLGAAVSGMAAATLARSEGHAVTVYDTDPARTPAIISAGFSALTGAWDPTALDGMDLVVTSPGVPERSTPITEALESGIPVWSEIEFAWRRLDRPCVAVTGTNGKTTVTGLIADMLTASGVEARALGNIGDPLSASVLDPPEVAVIEVSSFQLRFTERFHPRVAVVTNVAPDHLDWHPSFAAYLDAKSRIVANQDASDLLVFDVDDDGARAIADRAPGRVAGLSGSIMAPDGGVEAGVLRSGPVSVEVDRLAVDDPAFLFDLVAAARAALEMGATPAAVESVMTAFTPGRHRRTVVRVVSGVTFVDDSKATNPHAALASIRAFPSVVLIAGGLAKGLDIGPLAAEPNVRAVVAIGEAAPALLAVAGERGHRAGGMAEAVAMATGLARPGDTVLLAPGCASFDMFENYGDRGDVFARVVEELETVS